MRDELLGYYERELVFLRRMGAEFAEKYPKIASRLLLEPDKCEDPHVERMIEAVAFLASRVHLKIDDEFPEITESFLNVLYPHYLAPVPSMSIAQFSLDPERGNLTMGYKVEKGTGLYSRSVQGSPCRFRTCYGVTLWPIEVVSASFESREPLDARGRWSEATIKITLRCINEIPFQELRIEEDKALRRMDSLRFYMNGEPQLVYPLYETIFNNSTRVELRPVGKSVAQSSPILLPPQSLKAVGFDMDEGLLPYTARSFPGYRLMTEYFTFPDKFLFFDVTGLDKAASAPLGDGVDILIHLRDVAPPRSVVDRGTFQLGCTPIINLFQKITEPISLSQQQSEYHVIADVHRQMATEVYSIDSVISTDLSLHQAREFEPFYSYRHARSRDRERTFWYATRRPSQRKNDPGTEVYLSLVDLDFNPHAPAGQILNVHALCTNRDLPGKLPFGGREGDLEIEGAAPLSRVRCLKKPTDTLRPPMRRAAHWRLISHLALNHLSLVEGESNSPDALREILLLYDFLDSSATRNQIAGINRVTSRRVVRQTGSRVGTGFVRGIETTVELDEEQYVGNSAFLFACVLERFLGLYASVNSFSQLVARTRQREGDLKKWPPRAGQQIIL